MRKDAISELSTRCVYLLVLAAGVAVASSAVAQDRPVPDTYTAVTTNMSPADVELKADVLRWSSEAERAAVLAAMAAEDPVQALSALPTAGVVWRSGSAVGSSIKYAHRRTADDGSEVITLVTDRAIGSTSFVPWTADAPAETTLPYSVVELVVPPSGGGEGSLSLAAAVRTDADSATVSLERGTQAALLKEVVKQPKPYWATGG